MTGNRLGGVVPPLATPLCPDYEIDVPSLERLIDHLIDGGVSGLFVLGSTGEASQLTDAQRRTVIEATVRYVGGQVPVVVGVIDMSPARVAGHMKEAAKLGVDAAVATAPFYSSTHPAEIESHFRLIGASADLPLYAYDIPSRVSGTKLPPDSMVRLAADGVIAGVKDSTGNDAGIRQLLLAARDAGLTDFSVLTGSELTVDAALAMGVDGVVPGLGNVDPHGYVRLYEHYRNGELPAARAEQERLFRLFGLVKAATPARMGGTSAALGAFKAALKLRGVIDCALTAPPSIPLDTDEVDHVRKHLETAGLL
jgi:4-hydroxy-tetrahydrodipicolinate synthase